MSDLKQRILDILHKPQLSAMATVTEQGNPWVRYVASVGDGDLNIRFATFLNSRKVKQIEADPNVHITCGATSLMERQPYLQIQGKAIVTTDETERHAFWNDLLAPIFGGPDDPNFAVVVVEPYRIEYCSPGSFEPEVWTK